MYPDPGYRAWVLAQACAQLRQWGDEGLGVEMLSINVSARQLASASFLAAVREELGRSSLDPSRVSLEITESVLMEDVEFSIESLVALKALGVGLAVDDFGTGYSSLAYLRQLLREFGGNERLALAAWYQGPSSVRKRGAIRETRIYVRNVLALRRSYL